MRVQFGQHFVIVAHAVGVEDDGVAVQRLAGPFHRVDEPRLDVFVVHHQKAIGRRPVDGEEMHPVMVAADLHGLRRTGHRAGGIVRRVGGQGRAPGGQNLHLVARGHDHGVVLGQRHRRKTEQAGRGGRLRQRAARRQAGTEQARGDGGQTAHHEAATRGAGFDHVIHRGVGGVVRRNLVAVFVERGAAIIGKIALKVRHALLHGWIRWDFGKYGHPVGRRAFSPDSTMGAA